MRAAVIHSNNCQFISCQLCIILCRWLHTAVLITIYLLSNFDQIFAAGTGSAYTWLVYMRVYMVILEILICSTCCVFCIRHFWALQKGWCDVPFGRHLIHQFTLWLSCWILSLTLFLRRTLVSALTCGCCITLSMSSSLSSPDSIWLSGNQQTLTLVLPSVAFLPGEQQTVQHWGQWSCGPVCRLEVT